MGLSNSAGPAGIDPAKGALPNNSPQESEQVTQPDGIASNSSEQDGRAALPKAAAASTDAPPPAASSGTAGPATPADSADAADVAREILARAQAGDHAAFAQLYALHKRRVYSLCLRMLGNVAEAEDLTQESFLQLHRKIATFRGDSAFSTWLHRLTINVVLMHLRRKGLNLISLDEALDPSPDHGPARSFGAPDMRLTGSIDRMTLEKAVEGLPAGYRLIFVLHDIEGYEHNEIATLLDCSIGNSKSQLHKARMKLREALRAPADEEVAK
jgi:RNA polymerase sigma-70 factor, ECF subfamily